MRNGKLGKLSKLKDDAEVVMVFQVSYLVHLIGLVIVSKFDVSGSPGGGPGSISLIPGMTFVIGIWPDPGLADDPAAMFKIQSIQSNDGLSM